MEPKTAGTLQLIRHRSNMRTPHSNAELERPKPLAIPTVKEVAGTSRAAITEVNVDVEGATVVEVLGKSDTELTVAVAATPVTLTVMASLDSTCLMRLAWKPLVAAN